MSGSYGQTRCVFVVDMCGGLWWAVAVTGGVQCCKHLRFEVFDLLGHFRFGVAICIAFVGDPNVVCAFLFVVGTAGLLGVIVAG